MVNMTATREQEKKALAKIREIVESLGENSYIGTALEGCFKIAEENIEYDFADSMKDRLETAREEANRSDETAKTLYNENQSLKQQIAVLQEQLERELKWQTYEEKGNVTQFAYDNLAGRYDTRQLDVHRAKEMISELFGFSTEKIEIITSIPVYEINRHNQLRVAGNAERKPLYNATDWNYIRFNCCGTEYEMFNDSLRFFN
ncbi:MAG: hypothetical protein K2K02_02090 [Ruminococcus sp.]|nr:hypothetical protein [Ruminococcus sp.]